jgi:hypothetical protein
MLFHCLASTHSPGLETESAGAKLRLPAQNPIVRKFERIFNQGMNLVNSGISAGAFNETFGCNRRRFGRTLNGLP